MKEWESGIYLIKKDKREYSMKIVMMNGGLGNQVFQYIFYRALYEVQQKNCYLDDSVFFRSNQHNGYEMEKIFKVNPKKISDFFTQDVWEYIIKKLNDGEHICNILQKNDIDIRMLSETSECELANYKGKYSITPINEYNPKILQYDGSMYYYGYWINKDWFASIEDIIRKELKFKELTDLKNTSIMNLIKTTNSVAVHIRRGDFVEIGWSLPDEYYVEAIKTIVKNVSSPLFFIFSDDIDWCMNNYKKLGLDFKRDNIIFIDGNLDGDNYIDMQLMSNCKHMIIANSSFSYLGALLNTNENKLIINPIPSRKLF